MEEKMLEDKINQLIDKYFLHEVVDVFPNINRYGKDFLRVNLYLKDKDLTRTFNYSPKGYKEAIEFINKYYENAKGEQKNEKM